MDARTARSLLLIQAYEQTPQAPWSPADADWATAEARRMEGSDAEPERLLMRRAALAERRLVEREPAIARWLDGFAVPGWLVALALGAAVAAGLALDGLGGQARVNVLALPLLGVLAWNVAVYALLAVTALRGATSRSPRAEDGLRAALARWIAQRFGGARDVPALSRFGLAWSDAARPLHVARAAAALHALAAALALGLVAGLYSRGLVFEYRAGWESTFFDASRVHALLSTLFGPATALLGDPLPDAARLAALRFPASAGENAAPWIHRIALTVGLVVVLPRLVLAAWAAHRARLLERLLPIDLRTPYFERLLRELSGERVALHVQPYDHRAAVERTSALQRWLEAALGGAVQLSLASPAAYGDDPPAVMEEGTRLVLFAAGSTPEPEVHGDYLRRCSRVIAALVDETEWKARTAGADTAARLDRRRHAWRSMLDAIGVAAVFVDLDSTPSADAAQALAAALEQRERTAA